MQNQKSQNFDGHGTSPEQNTGGSHGKASSSAGSGLSICYGAPATVPRTRYEHRSKQYRIGGTKLITVPQAVNMKAAVDYAQHVGLSLVAHCILDWVGTDVGDEPDGKLFVAVREGYARWLRQRGVPFAGVWCREKKAGGQAEVEHSHLIVHLPAEWLVGAKLRDISGGLDGGEELLQAEAALHRLVAQYAGRPDDYAVKVKIPTDGGLAGPYNGRSYDGLYLLKGGGPKVWKLFPHSPWQNGIRKEWRKPQGIIFGKRCGVSQNIGASRSPDGADRKAA